MKNDLIEMFIREMDEIPNFNERVLERYADIQRNGYRLQDAIADVLRDED